MGMFFRKPRLVHLLRVKPGLIVRSICESDRRGIAYGYITGKFRDEPYLGERVTDTVFCTNESPRFKEEITIHVPSVYVDSGNNYLAIGKISLTEDRTDAAPYRLMKGDRVLKPECRKELMMELMEYHMKYQELPVFEIPKSGTYTIAQLNRFIRVKR